MANRATHQDTTFHVGDTIRVHHEITEGEKSRIQHFDGIVIAIKMSGDPTFIVRKIATNQIGVEKIFPLNAPVVKKIEVKRKGFTRRAKLYFLRDRIGRRATKVREAKRPVSAKSKAKKK
ncbi:50S ribosomal protein L19 [Candidatus Bathyarchaeota archaeon]|jgi:large subunit ribosomal protein L19|nr:50S ribosomal protein L19 [Candidatus Bathyarchaeota archaeon]